jgi:hypothetical protein
MSYIPDERTRTGSEGNLWGAIKRAFNVIHPKLDARLFIVEVQTPLDDRATVTMYDSADDGPVSKITATNRGPVSWPHVFELLTDGVNYQGNAAEGLPRFQLDFDKQVANSKFVFLGFQPPRSQPDEWFLIRTVRDRWGHEPTPRCVFANQDEPESLLHALTSLSLYEYVSKSRNEGLGHLDISLLNEQELLHRAAQKLALANVKVIGLDRFNAPHLFTNLNQFSLLPYEQKAANGCIIIAKPNTQPLSLEFKEPIQIGSSYRNSRKAIEMSTHDCPLLSDGEQLYGVAKRTHLNPPNTSYAEIQFLSRNWWRWHFAGRTLFEFKDGLASVPRSQRRDFEESIGEWRKLSVAALERIWSFVEPVSTAGHGAMVIISTEAEKEAQRLQLAGLSMKPRDVPYSIAENLTRIDGAVMLDQEGTCHGVGYIVDGLACGMENPSRGARYNSACRYVESHPGKAFAVVVSVDGAISYLPEPRTSNAV